MKEKATGLIKLCVSDDVMNHILVLTTPKVVWEKLENQYMSKMLVNKLFAIQCLYSLKMREEGDLQARVNAFNNILADLTRFGVNVDNEDKTIILICSLSNSYDNLVTTLTYGKKTITLNSISSTIFQHAQHRQSVDEGGENTSESLFIKECQDCGKGKGKAVSFEKKKRFNSKDRKTTECYGCKKIGNWKRKCPNKSGNNSYQM